MKRSQAFTLIELLVVVGIISILASIALVNMQEAQTRAKVARAHADMRSLATAIEAYAVDYTRYPPMTALGPIELFTSRDPRILTETHLTRSPSVVPVHITTPIAYITSRPLQPFPLRPFDPSFFDPLITYIYYRPYYPHEWEDAAQSGVLLPLLPVHDGWLECQFGAWVIWCAGPDMIDWYANWWDFNDPLNPGSTLQCPAHAPWSYSYHVPYDPTNGTTSFGNVFRSQIQEPKACDCPRPPGDCATCTPTPTPASFSNLPGSSDERDEARVIKQIEPESMPAAVWNWGGSGQGKGKGGGGSAASGDDRAMEAPINPSASPTPVQIRTVEDYMALMPDELQIARPAFKHERSLSPLEKLAALLATLGIGMIVCYIVLKLRQRKLIQEDQLGLGNVAVTDNVLRHIPGLKKRKSLDLSGTTITDSGAAQLGTLTGLEELNLSRTLMGDEGVRQLAALPALHTLNLAHTLTTDAGVAHLKAKTSLRVLVLNNTRVTGGAMEALLTLRGLRYLNLCNTEFPEDVAMRLRRELPFCEVVAGAAEPQPYDDLSPDDQASKDQPAG